MEQKKISRSIEYYNEDAQDVDSRIKYCKNCNHCYEKSKYPDYSDLLYQYYQDFPKYGKEQTDNCPKCI